MHLRSHNTVYFPEFGKELAGNQAQTGAKPLQWLESNSNHEGACEIMSASFCCRFM